MNIFLEIKTMKKIQAKMLEQNKELIKRMTVFEDKVEKKEKEEILVSHDIKVSMCFEEVHNLSFL